VAVTPSWPAGIPLSYESQNKAVPRIMIAKFGDGYEQRTPEWINNAPRQITIKVDQTRAIITQLVNFLASTQGSQAFLFTPPYDVQGTFVADQGWTVTEKGYDYAILECVLREVYELY
jgi:phage-related protein